MALNRNTSTPSMIQDSHVPGEDTADEQHSRTSLQCAHTCRTESVELNKAYCEFHTRSRLREAAPPTFLLPSETLCTGRDGLKPKDQAKD